MTGKNVIMENFQVKSCNTTKLEHKHHRNVPNTLEL